MGVHSTFFGPIKYAILPEHLKKDELVAGNGLLEGSTFVAILVGTMLGTICGGARNEALGFYVGAAIIIGASLIGLIASLYIPRSSSKAPELIVNRNIFKATYDVLKETKASSKLFLYILAISWFWFIGSIVLTELPIYTKYVLGFDSVILSLFLGLFSIGLACGSLMVNFLLKSRASTKFVPLALLGMSFGLIDLFCASPWIAKGAELQGLTAFVGNLANLRIVFDIFLISVCGGIFIVPLYVLLQEESPAHFRSRLIAANNIVNGIFMLASSLVIAILNLLQVPLVTIFALTGLVNIVVAYYAMSLLPRTILKMIVSSILRVFYKVNIQGLENYYKAGDKVIIIANHSSYLDPVLLAAFLPDEYLVAVNTYTSEWWWVKPFLPLVEAFPIAPSNPMSVKSIIKRIKDGKKCIIFPEGRLTTTGGLMKVYTGSGMIAYKSGAKLLPVRIDGASYTPFSYLRGKLRIKWFPKIKLTILPAVQFKTIEGTTARERRHLVANHLYEVMTEMMFSSSPYQSTLSEALADAIHIHGKNKEIIEDTKRKALSYRGFALRTIILKQALKREKLTEETIGVMLPTSIAASVSFFSLTLLNRVPAMLNFSMGTHSVLSCAQTANVKTIVSAREFIKKAKLEPMVESLTKAGCRFIFLDDLNISWPIKFISLLKAKFFKAQLPKRSFEQPAVILFTSGSEGQPKGVVLSHKNILANCHQMAAKIDFNGQDIAFNTLPVFHSFGLTVGMILPLVMGIKVFCYPSPLHYRVVPELIYDTDASLMFGTNTFLRGYARYAHPYDFYRIRYIFAGAEPLTAAIREKYSLDFGARIFEGYGATEASPAISTNTPMQYKPGTTGALLPGISYKLEPIEGVREGGRLLVKGPNIMLGYLKHQRPGVLLPMEEEWYDTGDVVSFDSEGYLTVLGRIKRFAKIGGEMISLSAVEELLAKRWPEFKHAVVAVADERKGEKLILLTEHPELQVSTLRECFKSQGVGDLLIPRTLFYIKELAVLGSGKLDYPSLLQQALLKQKEVASPPEQIV
jgi:acyl-[acyl-carrier-protein]-phospholipid O-acyltransferase/long-chain-fatty-acid--[acyl-carrier-protein] ligase